MCSSGSSGRSMMMLFNMLCARHEQRSLTAFISMRTRIACLPTRAGFHAGMHLQAGNQNASTARLHRGRMQCQPAAGSHLKELEDLMLLCVGQVLWRDVRRLLCGLHCRPIANG